MRQVELQDFQAHKQLVLPVNQPITCIVGRTDTGKSSVVRALRWLCLNAIAGDEFIREGATEACVRVQLEEGVIERCRGKHNLYRLDDEEFKAFGTGVPDEIAQLLSVSEINFQSQHDSPFWFCESAGEVSRQLNAIIDLSIIDSSLAYVASLVRTSQDRERLCKERVTELEEQIEALAPQQKRVAEFRTLEERHAAYTHQKSIACRLEGLLGRARALKQEVQQGQEKTEEGSELVRQAKRCLVASKQAASLSELLKQIVNARENAVAPPDISELNKPFKQWQDKRNQAASLEELLGRIETKTEQAKTSQQRLLDAANRLGKTTKGQACPLCGKPL